MVRLLFLLVLACGVVWSGVDYGAGEHHVCDSGTDIDDMSAVTVAGWIERTDNTNNHILVGKGAFASGGWQWGFRPDLTQCQAFVVDGSTGNINYRTVTGNCALNEMHHYAVAWNGAFAGSISLTFYYDGASQSTASTNAGSGTLVTDASNSMRINADHSGGGDYATKYACVAVWEAELSADEIKTLAAGGCRAALKVDNANLRRLYEIHGTAVATLYNLVGDGTCTETGTTATVELAAPFK